MEVAPGMLTLGGVLTVVDLTLFRVPTIGERTCLSGDILVTIVWNSRFWRLDG